MARVYEINWTTKNTEYEFTTGKVRPIRYIDQNGDPFPLKPGQTWVHIVPMFTNYWESADSEVLFDLLNKMEPGSGNWVMRYYASLMVYDESVLRTASLGLLSKFSSKKTARRAVFFWKSDRCCPVKSRSIRYYSGNDVI